MKRTRRASFRMAVPVTLAVSALLGGAPAAPVSAAPTDCRVVNVTHPRQDPTLAASVANAQPGDRLRLRGTCTGLVIINTRLTIEGVRTKTSGPPTISGEDVARPLSLGVAADVVLRKLIIRDGNGFGGDGGAILNAGRLVLIDTVVRGSTAINGGGITSIGTLVLAGRSQVRGNTASNNGGGIDLFKGGVDTPTLVLKGRAQVFGNEGDNGAGIHLSLARATLTGTAAVHHNEGWPVAGVSVEGSRLVIRGRAQVRDNTSPEVSGVLIEAAGGDAGLVMRDRGMIRRNRITGKGGVPVLILAAASGHQATLAMSGSASIRAHDSRMSEEMGTITLATGGDPVSATMAGSSLVTGNKAAPGMATWLIDTGCGGTPTVSGVKPRTSGNLPAAPKVRSLNLASWC